MRSNSKIVKWLSNQYCLYLAPKVKYEYLNELPEKIPKNKILVIAEGRNPDTLAFLCPCGCKSVILLNLLEDAKPRWSFQLSKKGNISIFPSIWRHVGCKSHFVICNSKVKWI
jgi:hypothetical protein